jgi:pimeloyl-ACP methyl ester carboxylesterase
VPYFERGDARLFYTDDGNGPAVLLLHGWSCDSHDWSWQLPALQDTYRCIALDQRGHGRSAAPEGSYRPQVLADDAAELLRSIAPGEAAIVWGHSMGTIVASALAVRHPDLVRALVLVDPVYTADDEQIAPVLEALRGPDPGAVAASLFATSFYTPRTPPFLREWHRRRVLGMPGHVVAGCMTGLYEGDEGLGRAVVSREYLSARAVPRLAFCAREATADFERTLPLREADRVVVLDGGHFLHQERAEDVNRTALDWLAAVAPAP